MWREHSRERQWLDDGQWRQGWNITTVSADCIANQFRHLCKALKSTPIYILGFRFMVVQLHNHLNLLPLSASNDARYPMYHQQKHASFHIALSIQFGTSLICPKQSVIEAIEVLNKICSKSFTYWLQTIPCFLLNNHRSIMSCNNMCWWPSHQGKCHKMVCQLLTEGFKTTHPCKIANSWWVVKVRFCIWKVEEILMWDHQFKFSA